MWDTCTFVLRDSSYQTTYSKFGYGNRLHVVVSCKIHSSSFPCTTVTLYICNVYAGYAAKFITRLCGLTDEFISQSVPPGACLYLIIAVKIIIHAPAELLCHNYHTLDSIPFR